MSKLQKSHTFGTRSLNYWLEVVTHESILSGMLMLSNKIITNTCTRNGNGSGAEPPVQSTLCCLLSCTLNVLVNTRSRSQNSLAV